MSESDRTDRPRHGRLSELSTEELAAVVETGHLEPEEVLEVLRNPFCTVQIAERILDTPRWLSSHVVRERLAGFRNINAARAMNLLATLPWLSLLHIAQAPKTPPLIRRQSERKLLQRMVDMSLGEKVALARLAHRPLIPTLTRANDTRVIVAMLDNPRLVETDVLVMIGKQDLAPEVFQEIARHHKWGTRYQVRFRLAESRAVPVPVALSALVQLRPSDRRAIATRPDVNPEIREAAHKLASRGTSRTRPSEAATSQSDDEGPGE